MRLLQTALYHLTYIVIQSALCFSVKCLLLLQVSRRALVERMSDTILLLKKSADCVRSQVALQKFSLNHLVDCIRNDFVERRSHDSK